MILDCADFDAQVLSDLLIGPPEFDQGQYLAFPTSQATFLIGGQLRLERGQAVTRLRSTPVTLGEQTVSPLMTLATIISRSSRLPVVGSIPATPSSAHAMIFSSVSATDTAIIRSAQLDCLNAATHAAGSLVRILKSTISGRYADDTSIASAGVAAQLTSPTQEQQLSAPRRAPHTKRHSSTIKMEQGIDATPME